MGAAVKIMLSYDYCHFEVMKSTDQPVTDAEIDLMRKDVQRLADKAVEQYALAKRMERKRDRVDEKERNLKNYELHHIKMIPEAHRTPEMLAKMKLAQDEAYWINKRQRYDYDYEDDFDEPEWEDFDDYFQPEV